MRRALLLVGVACASEAPSSPSIELAELCAALSTAECDRMASCGGFVGAFDRVACKTWFDQVRCRPTIEQAQKAVERSSLAYNAFLAKSCVDAVSASPCLGAFRSTLFVEGCGEPFAGKVDEGGACVFGAECKGSAFCNLASCPGVCLELRKLAEPCDARNPCDEELYCSTTNVCRKSVSVGQPCELSLVGNPCEDGSFCDRSSADAECVRGRGRGNACARDLECAKDLSCLRNLCSGGEDGDTCDEDDDCDDGLVCGSRGRCAVPVALGESCEGHGACRPGLTCTSSVGLTVCVEELRVGSSCSPAGAPCHLGTCSTGSCVAASRDGDICAEPSDCLPNRRCNTARCEAALACAL